jgi:beta-phosphoglucomutase-like phosphatase (HAD superfamily)/fucose permease
VSRRWATTGVFFVNGAAIGTWVAQIPWIQERFDLSKSAMGLVIVGMSLAVIAAFPIAGQAVVKHGSERMTTLGGIACALAVNLAVLAPHPVLVAAGLFVLGGASATMDVSMNSHGVSVERDLGKPIMSSLHAGWSFGGMIGAGFAAALTGLGADPRLAVAIASALMLTLLLTCARRIGHGSAAEGEQAPRFTLPSRGVLLLAILCLLVMVTEGAMADWGGIYLRGDLGTSAAVAALAFAFFTGGMTAGRVVGDWFTARIGPVAMLRWGALLTGVPLAALLLIGHPVAALLGMFAVGVGVANGVPLMFSAAGRQPDTPAGPGIAAVSSLGSLGFLVGPPVIGVMADVISLPWALATLVLGAVVVFVMARRAAGEPASPAGDAPLTFAAVISDLDGVLIDSSGPTVRSWRAWGERHGLDGEAIQAGNHGRPARAVIAEHVPAALVEEDAEHLAHLETTDTDGVVAFAGAADVLALPPGRVAIATSCTAPLARARLEAAGLPIPDVLVTADQVRRGKPAPDPYLLAAERLGVDPAACLVLEDAPAGIAAARAAGMTVWAVTTTHDEHELGGAARVASGLPEHLAALALR